MAKATTDPIYETEVFQVTDLPKVKEIKDNSVFLLTQDDKSKQIAFKHVKDTICKSAAQDADYKVAAVSTNISQLSVELTSAAYSLSADIKQTASQLSTYTADLCFKTTARVLNTVEEKLKMSDERFWKLQKYVNDQQLSTVRNDIFGIQTSLQHTQSTLNSISVSIPRAILVSNTETAKECKDYTDVHTDTLKKQEQKDVTAITAQMKSLATSAEVYALSNCLSTAVKKQFIECHQKENQLSIQSQVTNECISTVLSAVTALSNSVADVTQHTDELDIKLYGIKIEELDINNSVKTTTLSVGDIDMLSADVVSLKAAAKSLSADVCSLKTLVITEDVEVGRYALSASATEWFKANIKKDGYMPISVTAVKAFDPHKTEEVRAIPLGRYIVSDDEAVFEMKNIATEILDIDVIVKIVYLKKCIT